MNLEGLSATPEGHLLLGFRNPVPKGLALIIPLVNPNEVIEGKPARFDAPIQLDLDDLGIRDIAYFEGSYLIIAGSSDGHNKPKLYRWAGPGHKPQVMPVKHLKEYNPEAIIIYQGKGLREVQILSDDGTRLIDGVPGKEVRDPRRQSFRSFWVVEEKE